MLRRMYNWCIAAAAKPYAEWLLGLVSFVESSFFPVPPDAMLVPMALARPDRAWRYATVCTLTSVAGGVLGWTIGALLYDTVGQWLISVYHYADKMDAMRAAYAQWGWALILIKGLTPIPFKLVTIVSGLLGYNFALFVLLQLMYVGFYVGALANIGEIEDLFSVLPKAAEATTVVMVTAALLIPVRAFLLSAVLFHAPGVREKILKIWPFLLPFDELWALSQFLLLHHINFGLALSCTALLAYSPFAQRSLALMGAGELDPEVSSTG